MAKFTFYYKLSEGSEKTIVETKACKAPKRTKVWKKLKEDMSIQDYYSVGFDIVEPPKFIIQDWMGNRMFPKKSFDSFEEGWEFIYENVEDEESYEDIFVEKVSN